MIVVSGQFILGWCIGVTAYALILYGTHRLFTQSERRRGDARRTFRSRLNRHVYRGFRWS